MLRSIRLVVALALVGGAAIGGLTASAAPIACGPGGTIEGVGPYWLALRPTFTTGGAVTLAAAPAFDPNLLYATNGTVVMKSDDAGCSWATFWSATSIGAPTGMVPTITAMHVPSSANNSTFLYLGLTTSAGVEQVDTGLPTVVVGSLQNGKQVFTVSDVEQGLPPLGAVREVVANAQVPQVGYAVVDVPAAGRQLYATSDAGVTWAQRTPPGDQVTATGLSVHPTTPTELYGVSDGTVVRSSDGGASFAPQGPAGQVADLSVVPGGGGVLLAAARKGSSTVDTSSDRGGSWQHRDSPIVATSVAKGPIAERRLAVSDASETWVLNARQIDITAPNGAPRLLGLTAPTGAGYYVTGLRNGVILQLAMTLADTPQQPQVVNGVLHPVSILPRGRVTQFPSTLAPAGLRVTLPPGGRKQVPYELLVPRTPAPVDVMFLLDSTGSMSSVFDSLRLGITDITNALDSAGLDSRFGLGDFRDYPAPYGRAGTDDWPYRRDRKIGPADEQFEAAIEGVQAGGGTDDGGASPLTAVVQSTTGAGDSANGHWFVRPGQGAEYRPGALKLVLLAHDTPAHEGGQSLGNGRVNPGPTFDSTIAILRKHDVHVMGLAIGDLPMPGLKRLAEGSDTLAPTGGVDCDGNGTIDVGEGKPLVCLVETLAADAPGVTVTGGPSGGDVTGDSVGVTPAVVGLAAGIPDRRAVRLELTGGGSFVKLVSPASTTVNLRADNELGYELDLRCPFGAPTSHVVTLTASSPVRQLAETTLQLDCNGVPALNVPEPQVALAAAAVAAAGPAQPVPNANPNPNPNANPQTAPNVNANPAAASQEESQAQLAFAEDTGADPQLEMSAMRSAAFVGTAGLLLCAATAVSWRRREQEQPA